MRLTEVDFGGGTPVDAYGPGFFRLGERVIEGRVLILPGAMHDNPENWVETALAARIDVLFVGQGAEIAPLDPGLTARFEAAGIGVEVMATPSACRTYNVLLAEGRRVGLLAEPV